MTVQRSPYPGLRPFREDEYDLFFGREQHTAQLQSKLESNRFVAVVGTSGSGKSSLVRAGLIAQLKNLGKTDNAGDPARNAQPQWRIAEMRPGGSPIAGLARALLQRSAIGPERRALFADLPEEKQGAALEGDAAFIEATLHRGPLGLAEVLRETPLPAGARLLIFIDQFEEIFRFRTQGPANTLADSPAHAISPIVREGWVNEAEAFVALLLENAAHDDLRVNVLLTIRLDYLGDCAVFTGLPEAINASQFLTPGLTREQRGASIVAPARVCGADVELDLANTLLNETGPESDQLPLLQHCLMRMWTIAQESRMPGEDGEWKLTMEHYRDKRVGTLRSCLSNHADGIYQELQNQNARYGKVAETIFRCLTAHADDKPDTRRPQQWSALCAVAYARGDSEDDVRVIVDAFRRPDCSFLTPPLEKTTLKDADTVDICHESLIRNWGRLQSWVRAEAVSAEEYRSLERTARHWKEGRADLLDKLALESSLEWKKRENPSAVWAERYGGDFCLATEFLKRSQQNRRAHEQKVFLASCVAGLVVLAFVVTIIWLFIGAKQSADRANRSAKAANTARDQADQLVNFMLFDLRDKMKGVGLADLASKTNDYLQKLPKDALTIARRHQQSVASINLGDALVSEGKLDEAFKHYQQSKGIAEELVRQDNVNTDWRWDLAVSYERIGNVLKAQGKVAEALQNYQQEMTIWKRLVSRDRTNTDWQRGLAVSWERIGDMSKAQGSSPEALENYQQEMAIWKRLTDQDDGNTDWQRGLAVSRERIGDTLKAQGSGPEALENYQQGMAIWKRLADQDDSNTDLQWGLAASWERIGDMLKAQGKNLTALENYQRELTIWKRLADQDKTNGDWQSGLASSCEKVGDSLKTEGKSAEALENYQQEMAIWKQLLARDNANADWRSGLASSYEEVGDALKAQGKVAKALENYHLEMALWEQLLERDNANTDWQSGFASGCEKVGDALKTQGKIAEALQQYQQEMTLWKQLTKRDNANADWQSGFATSCEKVGDVLKAQGQMAEPLQNYQQELVIWRQLVERDDKNADWQSGLATSYEKIGDMLRAQGKHTEALEKCQQGTTIWKRLVEQDETNTDCQSGLAISFEKTGDILNDQDNSSEALGKYQQEFKLWMQLVDQDKNNAKLQSGLASSYERMGNVLKAQGKLTEALQNYREELTIWKELVECDNTNADAQSGLARSNQEVGALLKVQSKTLEAGLNSLQE